MENHIPHAFIKWAGGKKRVLHHFIEKIPKNIDCYYEPFVGGGAVFFELAKRKQFKRAVIADMNLELMTAFTVIKDDVNSLIEELKNGSYEYSKEAYDRIRRIHHLSLNSTQQAARFIYLNKTAFNGLYRVNKKGEFNVPFGKYSNPKILDTDNLKAVAEALQNVAILHRDFEEVVQTAESMDFVYLDPPYLPISNTSNFTSYTAARFLKSDHERLQQVFKDLKRRNVPAILSNSFSEEILSLYSDFEHDCIVGPRTVGGPVEYRKSVRELIIRNF